MNGKTLMNYQRVLALAEAGLYYGKDDFDKERYQELKDISLDLISEISSSSDWDAVLYLPASNT